MDTSYEKVCPGCGKSTTISEKFCAGCGHQFRTVFQDSASGGGAAVMSQPADGLRSTPLPLIVITVFLVLLCALVLLFSSNRGAQPVSVPVAAPAAVSPALDAVQLVNQIHYGQSPASVRAVAGEPEKTTRNMVGGLTTEDWYYPRGARTVQIHFNGNQVVDAVNTF